MLGMILTLVVALATLCLAFSGCAGDRDSGAKDSAIIQSTDKTVRPKH